MRDAADPRRIRLERNGPLLVEGPVTVTGDDGSTATSRRFMAALCTCRRSRTYPWCDTSHRRRTASTADVPGDAETDSDGGGQR
ncbi:CDGSH iron-sulfur domain-containing protein [Streptomyces sp. MBT67]|uniref:CDGSH iron-sulfur domain-containing protein n=1 Tax=unclassified Streptomyces TaxID=2593676 RepID=UPI00190B4136|nr:MULTISPECIES: CDGSH iron-sulfur domain-containing protein [unclassified Streptomyces]MBK3532587.1 CDGSH iron-sulfur domain-containing protein [Streptomyces sp. MBT72]MBK3538290.1 CDGSH iron-sulfur domain-containing protein [Streptomyces sp. MBT67]MBK3551306.1 CDGSH iron-sulfur domain-containing protein [Streptomyces sp. MBT61]MBK6030655.1 CDGSH iron-sulfur domain-containing protein [Streptomyces sp. MBT59]